jgi:hypothetical protein
VNISYRAKVKSFSDDLRRRLLAEEDDLWRDSQFS